MASLPFESALVTGASSGIGEAMARLLGRAGIPTVIVARRQDRLAALAAEHPALEPLDADLATEHGVSLAERAIVERGIDLVVNNAGFGTSGTFHSLDPDRLDREIALNIRALTRLSHAALRTMVPRGRGHLLNVSSVASFQPAPNLAVYAATKAFVTSLTESLHEEARGSGVKVTALCPGLTRTEFISVSSPDGRSATYPEFMWLESEQVAAAALADVARGRALSIPGAVYRGLVAASSVTPRSLARRLSSRVRRD
ncbi:MAG: SDR family NAD(P)-dependent oxidoreductase [Ilumatobacteraceae bacterium]